MGRLTPFALRLLGAAVVGGVLGVLMAAALPGPIWGG